MKSFALVSTLATGAAATIPGFLNANPFNCPGTVNNKCTSKQSSGWDYSDLSLGPVGQYNGFGYQGWTCHDDVVKRGSFSRRTGGRFVGASCGPDKSKAPSFGCGASKEIESFSLTEFFVSVEFDTELEFHYGMPDGSNCKIRRSCSKSGTKINNAQCGGAKNVSVVYPYQPNKPKFPKPSCSVGIHSMSFDCHSTTTKPVKTLPPATYTTSSATTYSTSSTIATSTSTTYSQATSTSSTLPVSTYTTSLTTSTIYTTSTQTYTACGRTISNCPAGNVSTVIVTVPVSTTICPVTLTQTAYTSPSNTNTYVAPPPPAQSSSLPLTTTLGVPGNTYTTTPTTPSLPVGTLPCPSLVPQCINTFLLFQLSCSDNTDHACYCPNELFVSSVFNCFYAHGESDVVISQAVIFFQGLCAQYVPSNPAIVTAPTVTSYLTATATSTLSAAYTTVVVVGTTAVPCTNSEGATIPGSSTIATYTNAMTVPQVGFSTGPSGGVGVIPITTPVQAGVVPQPTTYNLISTPPTYVTGTGSYAVPKPTGSTVVTAGAARHGAVGVAGVAAIAAVVAALL